MGRSENCSPMAQAQIPGSFTGGPDAGDCDGTFLIDDPGPKDKLLHPDVIEGRGRIGARDANGDMRYLEPPVGVGNAIWS